jgi:uncharacterized membrane protein SpoIIM required for sporulation
MELHRFVSEGRPRWQDLERLLAQVENEGLRALGVDDIRRFGRLYRQTASDLLYAQSRVLSADLLEYLNELVARAYAQIYARRRLRLRGLGAFWARTFPRTFRSARRFVALAVLTFGLAGGVGFAVTMLVPEARLHLLPADHRHTDPAERVRRVESSGEGIASGDSATFTAFLFTHNLRVTFLCFALGVTFGLGTLLILFHNGLVLGALAAAYHQADVGLFFWSWILPHGVPELFVTFLAGAAGLMMGRALLAPGECRRLEALRAAAAEGIRLVLGGVPILILAGFVEATISQIHEPHLPYPLKLAFALALALALTLYLALAGQGTPPETAPGRAVSHSSKSG